MPRDHYRIKKRVHYIEREAGNIAADVSEAIKDESIKACILNKLEIIKLHSEDVWELIEQDKQINQVNLNLKAGQICKHG